MSARGERVKVMALMSLGFTLVLSVVWEFLFEYPIFMALGWTDRPEGPSSQWAHVGVIMGFATLAVAILSTLAVGLLKELRAQEQVMRLKDEERLSFAADVAHELRTPLAVMRAHLDTMDENAETHQLSQDIDLVSRIVEQVLAKSRIDTLVVQDDDRADLSSICASVATFIAPLVIREGRSIEVVGAEQPVTIRGHTFALEQAVRNLVENAIKYSARGSTITLEVTQTPSVRVIDRGRGVPVGERDMIFERFRRADRRGGGSGLGLSIVRRVVEAHRGNISIDDTPGGGAIFVLTFPKI